MNVPVLGLVENMSYFECPDCHSKHYIFGESRLKEIAGSNGIEATAQLPIMPELAGFCDAGNIEGFNAEKYLSDITAFLTLPVQQTGSLPA